MSSNRNTVIRSLHDVGAAAWFGGSLMGAVGLNGATRDLKDPTERAKIAADGWARWAPVTAAAIGAHLIGGAGLLGVHRSRVRGQAGVSANTVVKTAVTAAAIGTTAYSGMLGAKIAKDAAHQPTGGAAVPNTDTPSQTATLQQQQRLLQWLTPVLTGVIVILGAQQGEQQRPGEQLRGLRDRAVQRSKQSLLPNS